MRTLPAVLITLLLAATAAVQAADGVITLSAFPTVAVADGRTQITITAEVRDKSGKYVPNGTQVLFEATIGTLRDTILTTTDGFARVTLVAPGTAGISRINASALSFQATGSLELEFVGSKADLSSAKEYFDIVGLKRVLYSPEKHLVQASGPKGRAQFRYRDFAVDADRLQVDLRSYDFRAENAMVKIAGKPTKFVNLQLDLRSKIGLGVAEREVTRLVPTVVNGWPAMMISKRSTLGPVKVTKSGIVADDSPLPDKIFELADFDLEPSLMEGKRIVAYPQKTVQISQASMVYGGHRVMRMPYYQMNPMTGLPDSADQIFSISNNQPTINYPLYLGLSPGKSSLLRLKVGNRFNTGSGASGGIFADYELHWDQGDEKQGDFTTQSLGRKDWGATFHQYMRLDDKSSATGVINFPAHRSLYGSLSYARQLSGWQLSYGGNAGHSVAGDAFSSTQQTLILEHDPIKVGQLPFRLYYGVTGDDTTYRSPTSSSSRASAGFRTRFQSNVFRIGSKSTYYTSLNFTKLVGQGVPKLLSSSVSTTLATSLGKNIYGTFTYDLLDDGFNSRYIGRHRLTSTTTYNLGKLSMSIFGAKSLDIDRVNGYSDLSYRVSPLWRFGGGYSLDRYRGTSYTDFSALIGYTIGGREIGISWSKRSHRLGLELLGAAIR